MTYIILMALIGATWRVVDGYGVGPTHLRSAILLAILLTFMQLWICWCWALGPSVWLWAVAIVAALQKGFGLRLEDGTVKDGWETFSVRQITHYYYAALPMPILVFTGYTNYESALIYVGLLVAAGLTHPVISRFNWHTRWAEGIVGAIVIGGVPYVLG